MVTHPEERQRGLSHAGRDGTQARTRRAAAAALDELVSPSRPLWHSTQGRRAGSFGAALCGSAPTCMTRTALERRSSSSWRSTVVRSLSTV